MRDPDVGEFSRQEQREPSIDPGRLDATSPTGPAAITDPVRTYRGLIHYLRAPEHWIDATTADGRLVGVEVSIPLLMLLVKTGRVLERTTVREGVPEDAEYCFSFMREDQRAFVLVFHHETFDPVPDGDRIPIRDVVVETLEFGDPRPPDGCFTVHQG